MKKCNLLLVLFLINSISCSIPDQQPKPTHAPQLVEAKSYSTPKDSLKPPIVRPEAAYNPEYIKAGEPTVIPANTNITVAKSPRIIGTGNPVICIPGKGGFKLPEVIIAKDSPYAAGVPTTTVAMNPSSKDNNPMNFSTYGKLQGLLHQSVSCIYPDKEGNLWIGYGGDGVTKFDGTNFTSWEIEQGFRNNSSHILEDRQGNMWFAGNIVTRYDGKNFTVFGDAEGLTEERTSALAEDKAGNIWFGTNGEGAIKYDGKSFTHFTIWQGLIDSFVNSITVDKNGNVWFGTAKGISKYDGKMFTNYSFKELQEIAITCGIQDSKENMWFGSANHGVIKFNNNQFYLYSKNEGLPTTDIRNIKEDIDGNLWLATNGSGAIEFTGDRFIAFTDKDGLPGNNINCIAEDKYGVIWLGETNAGLCKYNGKVFTHLGKQEDINIGSGCYDIFEDKKGNIWMGTDGHGVYEYDGKSFINYTIDDGLALSVLSIAEDNKENIWFGTTRGFVKFDGRGFTHYLDKDGMFNGFVFSILKDKKGNMWFGTAGGGVSKYDGINFSKYEYGEQGIVDNFIRCMFEDKSGNIWFGTNWGVSKFDGTTFTNFSKEETGFLDYSVTSICDDKSGNIWFATFAGISMYDGKHFLNFTKKDGLPSNDNSSVLTDRSGNLWVAGGGGLSKLTPDKLRLYIQAAKTNTFDGKKLFFKNYGYYDGFLGMSVFGNSLCEDKHGNIWVGANDRITIWHPSQKLGTPDTTQINTKIDEIKLFNERIDWVNLLKSKFQEKDTILQLSNGVRISKFKFDSLSKWYNLPQHLQLAYNNNFLTFSFDGISLNQSENIKYRFKLEGLDKDWSDMTRSKEAPYGNLAAGNYTFRVQAMNSDGYFGKESSYSFEILPPWWKTWWAYSAYFLLFVAGIWSFIALRLKTLRKEKILLEEKVAMQQALINERLRISRELHDEVGATLSGIAMYSHLTKEQIKNAHTKEVEKSLNIMQQSAGEMVNKLNDIVWLVNPEQDSLLKLIQRLEEYARDMAAIKNMQVKVTLPKHLNEHNLPVESRRNIYLFCKEAINNAVKYSDGSLLELNIQYTDGCLLVSVNDNGKGFEINAVKLGNGLGNMKKGAAEIGANLIVESKNGGGTSISMILKSPNGV